MIVVETAWLPPHIRGMEKKDQQNPETSPDQAEQGEIATPQDQPVERGGPKGPEPTRYGDWEKNGRCTDF